MSDDIFRDIWDKLADIYRQVTAGVAAARSGGAQGSNIATAPIGARLAAQASGVSQKIMSVVAKLPALFLKIGVVAGIVVTALTTMVAAIYGAAKAQLEQQRELSKVNAELAKSFAISDIADFFRNARKAQQTSQTTGPLNQSFTAFKDALAPIQAAWTNMVNRLLNALTRFVTPIVNALSRIITPILNGIGALAEIPEQVYYAVVDAFKTQAGADKARAEREQQRIREQQNNQMPVARMFALIGQQKWAAVTDSRKPLF